MKRVVLALALLAAPPSLAVAAADAAPAAAPAAAGEKTAVIPVKGMSCGGCVHRVTEAVKKLSGVRSVHTDLEKDQTTVVFDPARVKAEEIAAAVTETGYDAGAPVVK